MLVLCAPAVHSLSRGWTREEKKSRCEPGPPVRASGRTRPNGGLPIDHKCPKAAKRHIWARSGGGACGPIARVRRGSWQVIRPLTEAPVEGLAWCRLSLVLPMR